MLDGRNLAVGFDGSFDGFLTIVYKKYYDKLQPDFIGEGEDYPAIFYSDFIYVHTDYEQAKRVLDGLKKKSQEAAENLYTAFMYTPERKYKDKYMDLLKYIALAFSKGRDVDRYENLDYVLNVHNMAKRVGGEAHSYLGFLRFAQTKTGVLYAEFSPVNRVLPMVCQHFKNRLIDEKWVIEDKAHHEAAIYNGVNIMLVELDGNITASPELAENEEIYRALWQQFIETIAVQDRISAKRQNQHLPKRYRKHITEFARLP